MPTPSKDPSVSPSCWRDEHEGCRRVTCACDCHRDPLDFEAAATQLRKSRRKASTVSALNLMIDMLNAPSAPKARPKAAKAKGKPVVYLVWRQRGKGARRRWVVALVAGSRELALSKAVDLGGRVQRRRVWFT